MSDGLEDAIGAEEQQVLNSLMENIDEKQLEAAIQQALSQKLGPKLAEIRERAREGESGQDVRAEYEPLSPREKEDKFLEAVTDLVVVFAELRHDPFTAFPKLFRRIREPRTMEALLLIFDGFQDDGRCPDPEWSREAKKYVAGVTRLIAMSFIPEAYTYHERVQVAQTFYPNQDPRDIVGEPPSGQVSDDPDFDVPG